MSDPIIQTVLPQGIESYLSLLRKRRSCRKYDAFRPIPEPVLENCLMASALAPSACNQQPARFVLVRDPALRNQICSTALLPGISMSWLRDAPVIAVLCSAAHLHVHWLAPMLSGVPYSMVDCGIAGEQFVLAAEAQGVGSCWIGWFRPGKLRHLLGIPRTVRPVALISLGYPAESREATPKKDFRALSYGERWGEHIG